MLTHLCLAVNILGLSSARFLSSYSSFSNAITVPVCSHEKIIQSIILLTLSAVQSVRPRVSPKLSILITTRHSDPHFIIMKPPFRIAILECDTPLPNTEAKYGGYGGVFEKLLKSGAEATGKLDPGKDLQISKHQIVLDTNDYPDQDIDAILITGSRTHSTNQRR